MSTEDGPVAGSRRIGTSRAWREGVLVVTLYELYDLTRWIGAGGHTRSMTNARHLWHAETAVWLGPERWLNAFVSARPWLAVPADYAYAILHYVVTPAVLLWLWRKHPEAYAAARRTLATATLLALVGFVLFPLAPPRLLPAFVDTMARYANYGWWGDAASAPRGLGAWTNQCAAMPSLHVGWALWCGWQVLSRTRRRSVRFAAVTYPVVIVLVVLATANHYLADAVAGLVVLLVAAGLQRLAGAVFRYADTADASGRRP